MKGIVDRYEGNYVVIEIEGVTKDFAKTNVNPSVRAGDSVELIDGRWEKDEVETDLRAKKIKGLMENMWED
jgi:hypothetical protein